MKTLRDMPSVVDAPVLVRAPLNVPIENGVVANDYRLRKALPTIRFLSERRARVILISHIGEQGTETLAPVAESLRRFVPHLSFCPETIGPRAHSAVRGVQPGDVLMLENLRRDKRETANDPAFAKELAALADFFVEDSFDTCHRAHASIVGVPKLLPSYAGFLLEEEVAALSQALSPTHPALAIIGGAKFSTKKPVLETLIGIYDHVAIGGALANDFFLAQGHAIGKSLASGADPEIIARLLTNPKLVVPVDARVAPASDDVLLEAIAPSRVASVDDIKENEAVFDVGPATSALLADLAANARTILWNGPLGKYENGFVHGTDSLARTIAETGAHSVVGGGDTVASIETLGLSAHFSFVSTGGGAMLDFIAYGTLPGIAALQEGGI